jgi:plastocyanin
VLQEARRAASLAGFDAPPQAPPWKSALIAFDKCSLEPRVQTATVGQVLEVVNRDPILHNVHAYLTSATFFNHALSSRGSEMQAALDKPGIYTVRCDVHPWERATVVVTAGLPAVLTKADGLFEFENVPAGMYVLGAWQETTGISSRRVVLPAGRSSGELRLTSKDLLAGR